MRSSYRTKRVTVLACVGVVAAILATAPIGAQAPAEKATPKTGAVGQGTTTRKTPSTARAYDRALLRPALLKADPSIQPILDKLRAERQDRP